MFYKNNSIYLPYERGCCLFIRQIISFILLSILLIFASVSGVLCGRCQAKTYSSFSIPSPTFGSASTNLVGQLHIIRIAFCIQSLYAFTSCLVLYFFWYSGLIINSHFKYSIISVHSVGISFRCWMCAWFLSFI